MRAFLVATLLLAAALAGCASSPGPAPEAPVPVAPTLPGFTPVPLSDLPTFEAPLLVDGTRAGGEPVIAVTHAGTLLVSSHPGFTHYHPSSEDPSSSLDLVTPFAGQSYLWRSTDDGATWTHIGLPGMEEGPRSVGLGVSDPEFTVMEDGAICFTDLEGLAMSSTSCSLDDGQTWLPGNPVAAGAPNDRQWLASHGNEFYFTANYFADHHLRASTDKGLTWQDRGDVPCSGDLVAKPSDGHLVVGCGNGLAVSSDGGWTWSEVRRVRGSEERHGGMAEPAVDGAGNVWVTWEESEASLWAAGTPDEGLTWPWVIELTPHFRLASTARDIETPGPLCLAESCPKDHPESAGRYVWPWISAGSEGRFAVSWFGSYNADEPSSLQNGPWYVFSAMVVGGHTAAPSVVVSRLTPAPMHEGPICQSGTTCQVDSMQGDPSGDRRLGDFFETTVGANGRLYGAWSNTQERPTDVVSHVQFVRQSGGLPLVAPEDLGKVRPTQG